MFGMTAGGMGGMGQTKHSIQECVLVGSANAEQARALHSRLEGLSDRPPEQDDFHKTFYALKSSSNSVKVSVVRKPLVKDKSSKGGMGVTILEYQGTPDTQAHEKLVTRTVVRAHVGNNPVKFLADLGFKTDYEVVMKGKRYRTKQIETTIYKVQKVPKAGDTSNTTDISSQCLVEMSMQVHNLADPTIVELLNLAETLKPIVKLEKYDPNRAATNK